MENDIIKNIEEKIKEKGVPKLKENEKELFWVNRTNSMKGDNRIYDCPICNSRRIIAYLDENGKYAEKVCECRNIYNNRKKLYEFGLLEFVDNNNSFDSFIANEDWQKAIKNKAIEYVNEEIEYWFFIGGNVGTGKTKICTIICSKLLEKTNKSFGFLCWDSEYKNLVFKDENNNKIDFFKNVEILYIDDFFRLSDLNNIKDIERDMAKTIIDYRYRNKLLTIFSSELNYNELEKVDSAIASRIYQKSGHGKYILSQKRDINRNVRKNIKLIEEF